jgi:hypothetical protein
MFKDNVSKSPARLVHLDCYVFKTIINVWPQAHKNRISV